MLGAIVRSLTDVVNGTIGDVHVHSPRISVDDYSKVIGAEEIGIIDCATRAGTGNSSGTRYLGKREAGV